MLPSNGEIVAFAYQWNEAETEHARGGSGSDATIGLTGLHLPGGLQMSGGDAVVSSDALRIDLEEVQTGIEQGAAARALLTIYYADIAPGQVINRFNVFGIAGSSDDAFLPDRESNHGDGVSRKHAADLGKVRLAA